MVNEAIPKTTPIWSEVKTTLAEFDRGGLVFLLRDLRACQLAISLPTIGFPRRLSARWNFDICQMPVPFRIRQALSVLLLVATLAACGKPTVTHRLELSNESGTVVATLTVALPSSLPDSGQQFEGSWQLHWHSPVFPVDAVRPGRYLGLHQDGEVLLDLNPNSADNNVVLDAPAKMKQMAGRWRLATVAGFQPGGSFRSSR